MKQPRVLATLLIVVLLVAIAGFFVNGSERVPPVTGSGKSETAAGSFWSDLGFGALVGALVGAVGTHVLRERAEARREARELRGLLRLILAELTTNDRTMELLLSNSMAGNKAGKYSDDKLEDTAWRHTNVRLAQLLKDEHHFHDLNIYYRNNASFEAFFFAVAEQELDIAEPNNFPAGAAKMLLEQQLEMSRKAQEFLSEYVPGVSKKTYTPHYFTSEEITEAIKRLDTDQGEGWKKV